MTEPAKFKRREQLTPAEHLTYNRDGTLPVSDEWTAWAHQAWVNGARDEDTPTPKTINELTAEEHLERLQRNRGF